ncbi:hypothetical protein [Polaromonas sp.]|uniref:hypothetical protein n=1 Tax=Polaromonas sp. TaxID=1869339 RepID=UPI00272FE13D|nr:hypothetical protein [Polaromonas sp.]MDP1888203.1 hypothetical protein [Polaromonas sp.]MDP3225818.1 hypothetical protein [Rubrivivax sp.]
MNKGLFRPLACTTIQANPFRQETEKPDVNARLLPFAIVHEAEQALCFQELLAPFPYGLEADLMHERVPGEH